MRASVIVTGSSGGIGCEIVKQLIANDYFVVGLDICDKVFAHKNFKHIKCDLNKYASDPNYQLAINKKINRHTKSKKLHAIVNNASLQKVEEILALTHADWLQSLNVNLLAPFFLVKNFAENLSSVCGKVVNISSIHAKLSKSKFGAYAVTKSALSALARSLAIELSKSICIYTISPAAISTKMLLSGFNGDNAAIENLNQLHPSGKIGQVTDVANLVITLLDSNSQFLSGVDINLDGGISHRLFDV